MDDKRLDEMLRGLKDNYERLPEYSDNRKIMDQLPERRKKRKRFLVVPLVAVFTGFLLFFVLALSTVEDYQNAAYSKDQLQKYAEEKKAAFQQELGIDSINHFIIEQDLQHFIDSKEEPLDKEAFEEAKEVINDVFKTPLSTMQDLNENVTEYRAEQWLSLFSTMDMFRHHLDSYFQQLKIDHALDKEEQADLYENKNNYSGPIEIIEFLNMVEEQGYTIEKGLYHTNYQPEGLTVKVDYDMILNRVEAIEEDEGIRRFLAFISEKLDVHNSGYNNKYDIPWHEYGDILLEYEEIYRNYPENREFFHQHYASTGAVSMYLNDYIYAGMANHIDPVQEENEAVFKSEIESFVENHPDSIFWPIISSTFEDYKNGDWPQNNYLHGYEMHFLLNTVEDGFSYNRLYTIFEWPISKSTRIYYNNYEQRQNLDVIRELSPFEFLSLYLYTAKIDERLYEELYAGEEQQSNEYWQNMLNRTSVLVEKKISDDVTEFTLFSLEDDMMKNEKIAQITLEYNDGLQVIKEEIFK